VTSNTQTREHGPSKKTRSSLITYRSTVRVVGARFLRLLVGFAHLLLLGICSLTEVRACHERGIFIIVFSRKIILINGLFVLAFFSSFIH